MYLLTSKWYSLLAAKSKGSSQVSQCQLFNYCLQYMDQPPPTRASRLMAHVCNKKVRKKKSPDLERLSRESIAELKTNLK